MKIRQNSQISTMDTSGLVWQLICTSAIYPYLKCCEAPNLLAASSLDWSCPIRAFSNTDLARQKHTTGIGRPGLGRCQQRRLCPIWNVLARVGRLASFVGQSRTNSVNCRLRNWAPLTSPTGWPGRPNPRVGAFHSLRGPQSTP